MKDFDYAQFEKNLLVASRQIVQKLSQRSTSGDICSFALYSDESGSSISASANSFKYLAKIQKDEDEDYLYYKWSPAEWKYDSIENKHLDKLSDQLSSFSMELEGREFESYISELFDVCVNVLLSLKEEGLFKNFHKEFILLFDVSAYEDKQSLIKWAKQLNDEKEGSEFEKWLNYQDN